MSLNLLRRLGDSSSEEKDVARGPEQPVTEKTHSEARSLAQKLKRKIWGISSNLREEFRPPKRFKEAPNLKESLKAVIKLNRSPKLAGWNIPLIFIIPWFICWSGGVNEIAVFCLSFLAIIPLPRIQCIAADEISMRAGSLSVVIDIILVQAIRHCEVDIALSNLVGSMISNLLPTLGISIFIGGMYVSEQIFGMVAAQIYTSILMLGVAALLLPTLYYKAINSTTIGGVDLTTNTKVGPHILAISHGVLVILLFGLWVLVYICFQFFQRFSHRNIWGDNDPTTQKAVEYTPQIRRMVNMVLRKRIVTGTTSNSTTTPRSTGTGESDNDCDPQVSLGSSANSDEEQDEKPQMHFIVAMAILALTFVAIFFIGGALVTTTVDLASGIHLNPEFVSLIILPLLGNVEEIKSAVKASRKDRPREALAVAVGSSIDTALFVFPFTAIAAWVLRKPPLPLLFDTFEAVVLFLSVCYCCAVLIGLIPYVARICSLEQIGNLCPYDVPSIREGMILIFTSGFYPGSDLGRCRSKRVSKDFELHLWRGIESLA
ncbi:hypothetical protein H4582DRAFT_2062708 [Lactarius indigo]|nr:hypothetical protein H4582DRAFT_2062708 [Lactarius indigo]